MRKASGLSRDRPALRTRSSLAHKCFPVGPPFLFEECVRELTCGTRPSTSGWGREKVSPNWGDQTSCCRARPKHKESRDDPKPCNASSRSTIQKNPSPCLGLADTPFPHDPTGNISIYQVFKTGCFRSFSALVLCIKLTSSLPVPQIPS